MGPFTLESLYPGNLVGLKKVTEVESCSSMADQHDYPPETDSRYFCKNMNFWNKEYFIRHAGTEGICFAITNMQVFFCSECVEYYLIPYGWNRLS